MGVRVSRVTLETGLVEQSAGPHLAVTGARLDEAVAFVGRGLKQRRGLRGLMRLALLVLLSAADAGSPPSWRSTESEPVHFALFASKPDPDRNQFGKVLAAFSSPAALVASRHPLLARLDARQRALLSARPNGRASLVNILAAEVPPAEPVAGPPFLSLTRVTLQPSNGKPLVVRVQAEGCCDGEGKLEDIGLHRAQPARVWRDAQQHVRTLQLRSDEHVSRDNHEAGPVTEKNASEHTWTEEFLELDETGHVVTYVKLERTDNEMRYLPGLVLLAFSFTWMDGQLTAVDGIVANEDDETFDLALREQHWRRD